MEQLKEQYGLTGILEVTYSGSGDSGCIDGIEIARADAGTDIETFVYDQLETRFGGWEINEGSQGTMIIDFDKCTVKWSHQENVMETVETDSEESF